MRYRQPNVYPQQDGSWVIVWEVTDTRDGTRSVTIPSAGVQQLINTLGLAADLPPEQLQVAVDESPRRERETAASIVVNRHPGLKFGSVVSEIVDELGLPDTRENRRRIGGLLGELNDRKILRQDDEDRWWPLDE